MAVVNYADQYSGILKTKPTPRESRLNELDKYSLKSEDIRRARTINRDSMIFESASYREKN